jgi:hypothetical protein
MGVNKYDGVCYTKKPDKRVYRLWYNMLRRCYDKEQQKRCRGISYAECTVCAEWRIYDLFEKDIRLLKGYDEWLNNEGYCLDKDTLYPGNKVYCKAACQFIPSAENVRDIHRRKPQNIERLHELRKTKYMLIKDDEVLLFDSEKEACEYMGVVKCSISSCYRRGRKCKGYRIAKMDGKGEG